MLTTKTQPTNLHDNNKERARETQRQRHPKGSRKEGGQNFQDESSISDTELKLKRKEEENVIDLQVNTELNHMWHSRMDSTKIRMNDAAKSDEWASGSEASGRPSPTSHANRTTTTTWSATKAGRRSVFSLLERKRNG